MNHTTISLIPKVDSPYSVNHFWLISPCNIIYEIISKILQSRLKKVFHKLISPFRPPWRVTQDNTILAHELFHMIKHNIGNEGLMTLTIYLEKASDIIK
jgi:hypothetical protein